LIFPISFVFGFTPNFTEYITQEVTQKVISDFPFLTTADTQVVIKNVKLLEKYPFQTATYQIQFNSDGAFLGSGVVRIHFYDRNQRFLDSKTVLIQVKAKTHYIITTRLLKSHEIIKEDDLVSVYNEIYGKPKTVIRDKKNAIGKEAVAILPKGTLLTEHNIRLVPIVKVGSKVCIWYDKNNIIIKLDGVALQDGVIGDTIKVKNLSFSKELEGEVVDSANIKIIYHRN